MERLFLVLVGSLTASLAVANSQEWTRFRGPNGTGLSDTKGLPVAWTEADFNWKVKLPGSGHSSPVLWGDRIFLGCADAATGRFEAVCLSAADGSVLWRKSHPYGEYQIHKFNSFASGTFALDAERVFFLRQNGDECFLTALTHEGKAAWELPLGRFESQHGAGHSPIVYGDLVVLAYDQLGAGRIVAVDRLTGKRRWEVPRSAGRADYSVPCVFTQAGQPERLLFNTGEDGINAIDPATGEIAWRTAPVLSMRSVSSPVFIDGITFASCGSGGGGNYVVAIEAPADGTGEATVKFEVRRSAPYVPAPVIYRGLAFLWSDGGIVTCIDARTGEEKWRERVGGNFFSSPICVDGKLYNVADDGKAVVLAAKDVFEVLGRSDFDEETRATPAVADGRLYFRTLDHLVSIGGRKRAPVN